MSTIDQIRIEGRRARISPARFYCAVFLPNTKELIGLYSILSPLNVTTEPIHLTKIE